MKLHYKAVGKDGRVISGVLDAKDKNEAANLLRVKELFPITISVVNPDSDLIKMIPFFNKLDQKEVVFFTRQMASMLAAGLTLLQSLNILREQVQNAKMREIVNGLTTDIQGGKSFSGAITRFPDAFSPVYVSLIKTAETSGLLDKVLMRLADNLEKQQKLKASVKGALTYPIIVFVGIIIVMVVMMIMVIPQLTVMYTNLNVTLPASTQFLVNVSDFTTKFWYIVIGIIVVVYIAFSKWKKTISGHRIIDTLLLKIPVFGPLIKKTILTEFTRTFGLLVGSGALVVQSLKQSADVTGNILFKDAVLGIAERVEKGVTIGDAMAQYPVFPSMLVQMVKIGEGTGKLDESLLKLSEYFELEVDQSVKTLTTALEPFIMIVLGIGVAFLIISIITPIYNLTSHLGS